MECTTTYTTKCILKQKTVKARKCNSFNLFLNLDLMTNRESVVHVVLLLCRVLQHFPVMEDGWMKYMIGKVIKKRIEILKKE